MQMDYQLAFDLAPVGLVLSRNRLMVDCNRQVLEMFGARREALIGHSFELLYPTHDEFERTGIAGLLGVTGSEGTVDTFAEGRRLALETAREATAPHRPGSVIGSLDPRA